jgi:hypothetical protein
VSQATDFYVSLKITPKTETHHLNLSPDYGGITSRSKIYYSGESLLEYNTTAWAATSTPNPGVVTHVNHSPINPTINPTHRILILYNQCIHSHPHIQSSTVTRCDGPITHSRRAFMNRSHASHACGDHCCEQAGRRFARKSSGPMLQPARVCVWVASMHV